MVICVGFNAIGQGNQKQTLFGKLPSPVNRPENFHGAKFLSNFLCFLQSSEIQFFGATTLHTKLLKHWHEVPKENRDELQQKLFAAIIVYANGPKIVLNRLCISVRISSVFSFQNELQRKY